MQLWHSSRSVPCPLLSLTLVTALLVLTAVRLGLALLWNTDPQNQSLASACQGLPWWQICLQCGGPGFDPWVGKIPWRRELTPVALPEEFHGLRSLAGYSPQGHKESDMTEWLSLFTFFCTSLSGLMLPGGSPLLNFGGLPQLWEDPLPGDLLGGHLHHRLQSLRGHETQQSSQGKSYINLQLR